MEENITKGEVVTVASGGCTECFATDVENNDSTKVKPENLIADGVYSEKVYLTTN